uniref:Uncharacterized protein n=1 Tax=Siphoviridae sp. ctxMM9 TaxID=2827973 RepID=A0A8S5T7E7_9CAUD|nr:MAG TPA: hypothetical protein [Siphoviridae sp. ctxMM9]
MKEFVNTLLFYTGMIGMSCLILKMKVLVRIKFFQNFLKY